MESTTCNCDDASVSICIYSKEGTPCPCGCHAVHDAWLQENQDMNRLAEVERLGISLAGLAVIVAADITRAFREQDGAAMKAFGDNSVGHAAHEMLIIAQALVRATGERG